MKSCLSKRPVVFPNLLIGTSSKWLAAIKQLDMSLFQKQPVVMAGMNMECKVIRKFLYPNHMPQDFSLP